MTIKTKSTDPLFLAVEARLAKQDTATRPDRVKAFVEALESQITGIPLVKDTPVDAGKSAIGKRGIFWSGDTFSCQYSGECIGIAKDGKYLDEDSDPYDHFLSVESLLQGVSK